MLIARQGRLQDGDSFDPLCMMIARIFLLTGGPDLLSAAGDNGMQSCKQIPYIHDLEALEDGTQYAPNPALLCIASAIPLVLFRKAIATIH